MAKKRKPSALAALYPGQQVPASDPFAVMPMGPAYQRATGAKRLPKGPRDLNARVPRQPEAAISAPRANTAQRISDVLRGVGTGGMGQILDTAEAVTGLGSLYDAIIRGGRQAVYGDAYESNPDLEKEDALNLGINGLLGAAGPVVRGAGRAAAKVLPKAASTLAARAGRYLTEAPAIEDLSRPAYERAVEGPFTVVRRRGVESDIQRAPEAEQASSMAALRNIALDPTRSPARDIANRAAIEARGVPYDFNAPQPTSSLKRQAGIGRAYQAAVEGSPEYKQALFERFGETMPQLVEQAKAQNLDQLTEAAYRQLGGEVARQFDVLPLQTRYHTGEGEYASPNAMMRDVLARGNLNVFSGGEPHEFLSQIDPATGLSQNEMFRAVHDYMGHVVPGSMFGAPGEEVAYAAHAQTLSPLAQLALLSETRGQNSWVNYSPANADIIAQMNTLKLQEKERRAAEDWLRQYPGDRWSGEARAALERLPSMEEMRSQRRELGGQFQYAPQRAVLMPPEYLEPMTAGGTPDWLQEVLTSRAPTSDVRGVHFSRSPELSATDPAMYGTGARSGERPMVRREGLPNRTYFYSGPEGTVVPEESVGRVAKGVYEANLGNLYDLQADPEGLVRLAKAYNLPEYKPEVPENIAMLSGAEGRQSLPDIERLVRDYGYSGYLSDVGRQRAAAMYEPVLGLRPLELSSEGYAAGGAVCS